jgi:hypothetical protein
MHMERYLLGEREIEKIIVWFVAPLQSSRGSVLIVFLFIVRILFVCFVVVCFCVCRGAVDEAEERLTRYACARFLALFLATHTYPSILFFTPGIYFISLCRKFVLFLSALK